MRFIKPSIFLIISLVYLSCSSDSSPTDSKQGKEWETVQLYTDGNLFIENIKGNEPINIITDWESQGQNSNPWFTSSYIYITCEYYNSSGNKVSEEHEVWESSDEFPSSSIVEVRLQCYAPSDDEVIKLAFGQEGKFIFDLDDIEITQEQLQ